MKSSGGLETFPVRPGSLLAHQGGWDEILLVVGPLAVVGVLLWLANRRVSAQLGDRTEPSAEPEHRSRAGRDTPKR